MTTVALSETQRRVVQHENGPMLVVAGPGSGKTRVLTERVRALLDKPGSHSKVLALTFSNKAAIEMAERLEGLGEATQRATVSTIHGFCLELLSDRGRAIGLAGEPQIFERAQDRRQMLLQAVQSDPWLSVEMNSAATPKDRAYRLDAWLKEISNIKAHPISLPSQLSDFQKHLLTSYNDALASSGAFDFDDLLVLAYRLLSEVPQVADLYRRIYQYICVDEAQDLNEAQYAVLTALCGSEFKNVMMVGDPKQSIYGFNTSSPVYMEQFEKDFGAIRIELRENFRSSSSVVEAATKLLPEYSVDGQLPMKGLVEVMPAHDEKQEASLVVDKIQELLRTGHPDVEGEVRLSCCAILGRNRYCLVEIERELLKRDLKFYKRLSAAHEYESEVVQQFLLALRVVANPSDRFHSIALLSEWGVPVASEPGDPASFVDLLAAHTAADPQRSALVASLRLLEPPSQTLRLSAALDLLRGFADTLVDDARDFIYRDADIIKGEWDQYLRNKSGQATLGGFLSSMALGITQKANSDGIALMTVHASKGLEFDVVFLVGMAEGVFPDYRALSSPKQMVEEKRNAFVAATRSKRLLFLTYPHYRKMPWGDLRASQPSRYIATMTT